jgi:hypothetical protein
MQIGHKNGPEVGKWYFLLSIQQSAWNLPVGWNRFYFALFKLHCYPQQGEAFSRKHHNGIQFSLYFWLPFYLGR